VEKPIEEALPKCGNRILHMSAGCHVHLENWVRPKAREAGLEDKEPEDGYAGLNWGLDYCRTFSAGPEEEWKSMLEVDIPFNHDNMNFICTVCKRVEPGWGEFDDKPGDKSLKSFFTIGMIFSEGKGWSFHS